MLLSPGKLALFKKWMVHSFAYVHQDLTVLNFKFKRKMLLLPSHKTDLGIRKLSPHKEMASKNVHVDLKL